MTSLKRQLVAFSIIGGIATAVQYALLTVLVEIFDVNALVGSSIGFTISAVLNYRLNHYFTFGGSASHTIAFPRFVIVAATGLLLNTSVMLLLHTMIGMHYLVAQVLATAVVFVWAFTGNRLWSFR